MGGMDRWRPGDAIVLRYITRVGSRPGMSWPARVVADGPDLLALWIPAGVEYRAWRNHPDGTRELVPARWRRDTLRLMFPGRGHSVWLSWDAPGRLRGYYVNFEEPFRRTRIGVDTNDHVLDIVIGPDRTWVWKDRDEFEQRVREGVFLPEFAGRLLAEAAEVVRAIEAWASPFSDGWEAWRAPGDWPPPALPGDWDTEPATTWPERDRAYGPEPPR